MLMTERCSLSCVETKFLLWPDEVRPFLEGIEGFLSDPSVRRDEWRITTVYLDRPDGFLARSALACPELHVELRLREFFTLDGGPISPFIWVESKVQDRTLSSVNRFQLHRSLVPRFLRGDLSDDEIVGCQERYVESDRVLRAARAVREVVGSRKLQPAGAVTYRRSTFEGGSPLARLTLDREISYHLNPLPLVESKASLERNRLGPAALEETACVVEVKHRRSRPPDWNDGRADPPGPVEYSKFLIVSALAQSERMKESRRKRVAAST
jgi:VTC domain-containing protein